MLRSPRTLFRTMALLSCLSASSAFAAADFDLQFRILGQHRGDPRFCNRNPLGKSDRRCMSGFAGALRYLTRTQF